MVNEEQNKKLATTEQKEDQDPFKPENDRNPAITLNNCEIIRDGEKIMLDSLEI